MAKRDSGAKRAGNTKTLRAAAPASETLQQRLVAFAEQLGRIAGTVQAKAEVWTDRDALSAQVAGVRDAAVDLLGRLRSGGGNTTPRARAKKASKKAAAPAPKTVAKRAVRKQPGATRVAASRGLEDKVSAPGKKHRKPLPSDPEALVADSQAAKLRTAMPMSKTSRLRGRG